MTPIDGARPPVDRPTSDALHARVQRAIRGSRPGGPRFWEWGDRAFDGLARALFAHQFERCPPYRHFCRVRGIAPGALASWEAIPAVPTDVWKDVDLRAFPPEETAATFLTSGTTRGVRGRHHLRRTDTYAACLGPWLDAFLLPGTPAPRVLALAPSWQEDPASSLSFMIQWAVDRRGAEGSRFLWTADGPDTGAAWDDLATCRREAIPVALMGTSRALEELLGARGSERLELPPGSRVMETGGGKGTDGALTGDALRAALGEALGVPREAIVSEYGMTELASQGWHPSLRAAVDGETRARFGRDHERLFAFPPWCRVRALDPDSLRVLPPGERGLLCFWDLGNVDSILAVLTADEGFVLPQGVCLLGRAQGATPRGCSLAVGEILGAER